MDGGFGFGSRGNVEKTRGYKELADPSRSKGNREGEMEWKLARWVGTERERSRGVDGKQNMKKRSEVERGHFVKGGGIWQKGCARFAKRGLFLGTEGCSAVCGVKGNSKNERKTCRTTCGGG